MGKLSVRENKNIYHCTREELGLSREAASELLEIFQWSGSDLVCESKLDKIKEELADVLCYSILLADRCGLDMDEIINMKVKRNAEKYPVEAAYGNKEKYTELKAQGED